MVERPRGRRGLRQLRQLGGAGAVARRAQLPGQPLALGDEVLERDGLQPVGGVVALGHGVILPRGGVACDGQRLDQHGRWLRRGAIYQVYPRSFQDTDGDGVGDLDGVRRRLRYLRVLGIDAVWLSPFYRSPMADFGYDVSDHCAVDPRFGTLADFDALAEEARRLGLELILDYVPNHTSIEHPWFHDPAKRDWYLWHEGDPDTPPNNWVSNFGGSAWAWDAERGAWYYHAYLPEQPDLNWRNPEVRAAMLDVLRFWFDHGADGFRVDALRQCIKDDRWRDNPPNPDWREGDDPYAALIPEYTTDRDEVLGAGRADARARSAPTGR